jgi:hypothetical protein
MSTIASDSVARFIQLQLREKIASQRMSHCRDLHGLGWEHSTVPPALLHRDTTVVRLIRRNGPYALSAFRILTYVPNTGTNSNHDWKRKRQRELADTSWSGKFCTHRSIIVNRLRPSQPSVQVNIVVLIILICSMAPTDTFAVDTATNKWTDFYAQNRNDGGPFQTLFETNEAAMARTTAGHLNNVSRLTETITGSDYGNMLLVPGKSGTMQLIHHGFACNTADGFSLAFAHGNLEDTTTFKTVDRGDLVAPAAVREAEGSNGNTLVPTLESMMAAESPEEFARNPPEPLPYHAWSLRRSRWSEIDLIQGLGICHHRGVSDSGSRRR